MMRIADILSFLEQENILFSFHGSESEEVERFSSLTNYKPGTFTWVKMAKSIPEGFDFSQVRLVFAGEDVPVGGAPNVIRTSQSKQAFFSAIEHFYAEKETLPAIGQFTYIGPKVNIGENVRIGHNCILDGDITIGNDTVIWNNVTIINRVAIGKRCDIRSGVVIGHDGFAYTENDAQVKTMVKHFGGVTIGDDVLVGENTCVSRGTIDDTALENGVKIDALSHIAHNCQIAQGAAMAGPCRTSGSSRIGRNAYLAGSIVRNQCSVGENAFVGIGSVVVKDVPANTTVVGNPAKLFSKKED